MQRRDLLKIMGVVGLLANLPKVGFANNRAKPSLTKYKGNAQPFDYAWLKGHARALSQKAYQSPQSHYPDSLKNISWDHYQAIRYHPEHALWANEQSRFRASFFHRGFLYKDRVQIFEIVNGQARELAYDPAMFDLRNSGLNDTRLPSDLGFAGFRIGSHLDFERDIAAFLGASYFRAVGSEMQYGLSARGLLIDCGMERAEEFPVFTSFWLERPAATTDHVVVYALLDSPSVTGAYRFDIFSGANLVMDIDAALYPRKEIERIGIAPLTSMYLYGENERRVEPDWRPEIHDSDGLAICTGNGEWIWRPVTNPANLRFSAFQDKNPRGFGLLQRDRNFDHYQDDGVFYDRRPSLWVEPKAAWGEGAIHLVELPAPDETYDNIVAYWNPVEKPKIGQELLFGYRLHWGTRVPISSPLAQVVATRTGIGGIVGQKRQYFSWRFTVDFAGGALGMLGRKTVVEPVISASRGKIEITSARPLDSINGYRAMFDLKPLDNSNQPIDIRLYLRADGRPLSETWIYQWTPSRASGS